MRLIYCLSRFKYYIIGIVFMCYIVLCLSILSLYVLCSIQKFWSALAEIVIPIVSRLLATIHILYWYINDILFTYVLFMKILSRLASIYL